MNNFLNPKLSPKVTCNVAVTDDYEASNLIHNSDFMRSRGFLAYSSTKPPVDVDFELLCPINIHYISINATVGSQKCTGIEILAKNNNAEYTSIAKAIFEQSTVMFCNSRTYSKSNPPPGFKSDTYLCFFKSNTFRVFQNASFIRIHIIQTKRSVPCLGKVEIWGKPSKQCSLITVNTVNRLTSNATIRNEMNSNLSGKSSEISCDFKIPDEFKDALTFEIMAYPMTLPSGSTVDQSTLEKYINTESSCGRQPSDPFTGLKFTKDRKPILNMSVKSRIDIFLLKNASHPETFNLKRTVATNYQKTTCRNEVACTSVNASVHNNIYAKRKRDEGNLHAESKTKICDYDFTSVEDENQSITYICTTCQTDDLLYSIPCKHLYCRKCLIEIYKDLKCHKCNSVFDKKDVNRVHH